MDGNWSYEIGWNHQARKNGNQCQEVQVPKKLKAAPIFMGNKEGGTHKEDLERRHQSRKKPGDGQAMENPGKAYYKKDEWTAKSNAIKRLHKMRWEKGTWTQ